MSNPPTTMKTHQPTSPRPKRIYGWKREGFTQRALDRRHPALTLSQLQSLPPITDLRPHMPPVYDQGQLGSCTANALAGAVEFKDPANQKVTPSRLFIYYNERVLQNTVNQDSGSTISAGIQTLNGKGVCPESDWPYVISKFTQAPPPKDYSLGLQDRVIVDTRCTNIYQIKYQIYLRNPVAFGFEVYDYMESDQMAEQGVLQLPTATSQYLGGHAIDAVGYDDTYSAFGLTGYLICRNSWGADWGLNGYFYMPYAYAENSNLADDFWGIDKAS